jgi:hypothetical protein
METDFLSDALDALDLDGLAAASNIITGGVLRAPDVRKVLSLVSTTAIRTPGKDIIVAGIRAHCTGSTLTLGISGDVEKLHL